MTHPGWALQKAVFALLSTDPTLTGLLGGANIHDGALRRATLPFVVIEPTATTDAAADLSPLSVHELRLSVWSRAAGKRDVFALAEPIVALLDDADLTLDGHRLVNLRVERQEVRQLADRRTWRGDLRFRAVTEPLA